MAKRSAALVRAEKATAAARKRLTARRRKAKMEKPVEIAATIGGGYVAGWIDKENPPWLAGLGLDNPSLYIGGALMAYGYFSSRSGQMEKVSTSVGTGIITAYAYNLAQAA